EAPDQPVIAPAARDRAEAHRLAVFAFYGEGQFNFEDRSGVVFEAADDGRIDNNSRLVVTSRSRDLNYCREFGHSFFTERTTFHCCLKVSQRNAVRRLNTL